MKPPSLRACMVLNLGADPEVLSGGGETISRAHQSSDFLRQNLEFDQKKS